MPILHKFDIQSVHPPYKPTADTLATLKFPCPFITPSHLPHDLCWLDIRCEATIHVKLMLQNITESCADYHITIWYDGTLYSSTAHVFALASSDLEFLTGEHMCNCSNPSSVCINFEHIFITPPKVVIFFNSINLDKDHNWHLSTTASDINVIWQSNYTFNQHTQIGVAHIFGTTAHTHLRWLRQQHTFKRIVACIFGIVISTMTVTTDTFVPTYSQGFFWSRMEIRHI